MKVLTTQRKRKNTPKLSMHTDNIDMVSLKGNIHKIIYLIMVNRCKASHMSLYFCTEIFDTKLYKLI